jgi:2-dehydro-3-deoxyphosphogluconate aldolase/(4S)-4-hydroxy-2-oxoglutarate aldolase
MVILRGFSPDRTVELARTAWAQGITAVEVPVQDDEAFRALAATVAAAREAGAVVGAGTVITGQQVAKVAQTGGAFTVSPGFDPRVSAASLAADLPHLPGVATPTEVQRAYVHGHRWLKLFPATVLTPDAVSALHGPFPAVRFVATGGVDVTNAHAFRAAGVAAVSLGSSFASASSADLQALVNPHH